MSDRRPSMLNDGLKYSDSRMANESEFTENLSSVYLHRLKYIQNLRQGGTADGSTFGDQRRG